MPTILFRTPGRIPPDRSHRSLDGYIATTHMLSGKRSPSQLSCEQSLKEALRPRAMARRRRSASTLVAGVAVADFEHHVGELPWGWWLRANPRGYEDASGRNWASVRDAFWEGELGFPPVHFAPEQHELMLRVMTAIDARWFGTESNHDVFGGDMMFWRFHLCWLASIGMVETSAGRDLFGGG